MAQFLRPVADISNPGGWINASLYTKLDEEIADGTFTEIKSSFVPSPSDFFEVKLSSGLDPTSNTNHILRYQAWNVLNSANFRIDLYQGSTLIASAPEITLNESPTLHQYILSTIETDAITDYSDLRIRAIPVSRVGAVSLRMSWIEFEIPDFVAFTPPVRATIDSVIHPRNVDSIILKDEELNSIMNT